MCESYTLNINKYTSKSFNHLSKINGYMIAVVCAGSLIARIFNILGIVEEGMYPIIVVFALIVSLLSCFILTKFKAFQMNKFSLIFLLLTIAMFLISYLLLDNHIFLNEYFIDFLSYGLILFIMMSIPFSYEKVIAGVSMLTLLILINPVVIVDGLISERGSNSGDFEIDMGLSYALLPSVVAGVVHFFYFRKQANYIVKISYFINLFIFVLLIIFSIRGVILSLFVLIYALISSFLIKKSKMTGKILIYTSLATLIVVAMKINDIILFTYNYLLQKGIEFAALTKSVQKMQLGSDLSNGRSIIYEDVMQLVVDNPVIGKGISYYAIYSGGRYPHNIVLQLLLETGIVLTIPIIIIILLAVKVSFSSMANFKEYHEYKAFIMFAFVSSIPRLMF